MSGIDADLIIVGAGPAGLTAAQYGGRANLRVLVIEALAPGGQALNIDTLENYPGLIPPKPGFDFSEDLRRQAEGFGARFITESALSVQKKGNVFQVQLGSGETRSSTALIAASGAKHRALDIPGEAEFRGRGVSYCAVCDGPFFKGKKMFVIGGGDAACGEAQYLSRLASRVILVHRRGRFRAQRALAERVLQNPAVEVRFNTRLREIRGENRAASVVLERGGEAAESGEIYEEDAAAVFIFAGTIPQTGFITGVETDENGYIVTDQRMACSLPGLFAAGDVRASPFRQVVVAAGEGAVAAHSAAEYIDEVKGEAYR
jgi:thioredoxin reductase (NADPH)